MLDTIHELLLARLSSASAASSLPPFAKASAWLARVSVKYDSSSWTIRSGQPRPICRKLASAASIWLAVTCCWKRLSKVWQSAAANTAALGRQAIANAIKLSHVGAAFPGSAGILPAGMAVKMTAFLGKGKGGCTVTSALSLETIIMVYSSTDDFIINSQHRPIDRPVGAIGGVEHLVQAVA